MHFPMHFRGMAETHISILYKRKISNNITIFVLKCMDIGSHSASAILIVLRAMRKMPSIVVYPCFSNVKRQITKLFSIRCLIFKHGIARHAHDNHGKRKRSENHDEEQQIAMCVFGENV